MRIRKDADNFNNDEITMVAEVSNALGHPLRVRIFRFIYTENMQGRKVCNKDLCAAFDYSQSTLSEHVGKLRASGLLEMKKLGSFTYYFVNLGLLARYLETVKKLNQ